ncbi:MAG: urease accessory protein UreF [Porticoccaceae bacterium]
MPALAIFMGTAIPTPTRIPSMTTTEALAPLLHLLRLTSPSLPIGTFAWSQGLASAVELGWVDSPAALEDWLRAMLERSFAQQELPLLVRLLVADPAGCAHWNPSHSNLSHWNEIALALRETAELRREDSHCGAALLRLLADTGVPAAIVWPTAEPISYLAAYALACAHWHIDYPRAATGLVWSWLDNQIAAALKLSLLGQTQGQRIAVALLERVPALIERARTVTDADIGISLPGQVLASMLHETQYSRLFRS